MYIIGNRHNNTGFKLIYGVFKDESSANSYLENTEVRNDENLSVSEFNNFNFPFFIIEELESTNHFYHPISKDELRNRIERVVKLNDFSTMYFNLWKIGNDNYNKNYPNEPFLNGRDWHLHFTDHDIQQIEMDGFDEYWNDILNA